MFGLLLLAGCDLETSGTGGEQQNQGIVADNSQNKEPVKPNWDCIPGQQVGLIKAGATEVDIINSYGADQVVRRDIGLGEGESAPGTIVFPDTKNQLIIEWQDSMVYQKIARIRIEGEESDWATPQGVRIGTTLERLEAINGKPFKFFGFEWDYSGLCKDWQGGNIDPKLSVFLNPGNPEAVYPDLLGDAEFLSTHPKASTAQLQVSSFVIEF